MQNIFEIYDIGTRVQVFPIAVISFALSMLDIFVLAFPDTHTEFMFCYIEEKKKAFCAATNAVHVRLFIPQS